MNHSIATDSQVLNEDGNYDENVLPNPRVENNHVVNSVGGVSQTDETTLEQNDAVKVIMDAFKDIMVIEDTGENSKRSRNVTMKGKAYQKDELLKRRKSSHNLLMRQFTFITQCIESDSIDMVNIKTTNMDHMFDELAGINYKYLELLDENNE